LIDAVKAGASGYLLKSLDSTEFLAMLDGVQRGESAMQRQTMSRLLDSLSDFSREPTIELTVRELELLKWVAQGYSNKAIAKEMSISPNTVKYHMKSVLQKLSVQNRAEAVATAIRAGWLPEPAARA
jgi:DNA-binding NarL/FixJ family response regulator